MEHYPALHRPSASALPASASCTGMPDGPNTVLAVRAQRPPAAPAEPPNVPHRRASPLLPFMIIGVMLGLALLSLAVSLRL